MIFSVRFVILQHVNRIILASIIGLENKMLSVYDMHIMAALLQKLFEILKRRLRIFFYKNEAGQQLRFCAANDLEIDGMLFHHTCSLLNRETSYFLLLYYGLEAVKKRLL